MEAKKVPAGKAPSVRAGLTVEARMLPKADDRGRAGCRLWWIWRRSNTPGTGSMVSEPPVRAKSKEASVQEKAAPLSSVEGRWLRDRRTVKALKGLRGEAEGGRD